MNISHLIWVGKHLLGLAEKIPAKQALPVLVVEDSVDDGVLLERAFGEIGIECKVLHQLEAAAEVMQTQHFRMLLLDVNFPNEDGLRFAQRFVFPKFPYLPVAFVTGHEVMVRLAHQPVVLSPGRAWVIVAKGHETGSLREALRGAVRLADGHNGTAKLSELSVLVWFYCLVAAAIGYAAGIITTIKYL